MKLGIMQLYFFPYLGHFDLINRTDRSIVFETAQYIRQGWVNRNYIPEVQELARENFNLLPGVLQKQTSIVIGIASR